MNPRYIQQPTDEKVVRFAQKEVTILNLEPNFNKSIKYEVKFRKRTFKTAGDENILFDEVKLRL